MKFLIGLAALALPGVACAQEVRSLDDDVSPPAAVEDVAWLTGSWGGTGFGGESHISWLPPVAGQMGGVFHQSGNGGLIFYEILQIAPHEGSLAVRLKHFNPDLEGWEDATAQSALEFPLVAIEGRTAFFSGLTYELVDPDTLHIHLRMRRGGEEVIETFRLTRIE